MCVYCFLFKLSLLAYTQIHSVCVFIIMAKAMKSMKAMKAAPMKTMKKAGAMKAMKPMKAMKKRVSIVARGRLAKSMVLKGSKDHTAGGLKAKDLMKNKYGKIVSKKRHAASTKSPWMAACKAARKALGIKGFAVIGGKTPEGKALYAKARSLVK